MSDAAPGNPLWLELPPHQGGRPARLLVFLHGAGSRPENFLAVAVAWQFKFPSASAIILEGLVPGRCGRGRDWYGASGTARDQIDPVRAAGSHAAVIGFSQGAWVTLELALQRQACAGIFVSHAGRLLRPLPPGIRIEPTIHLLHGEFDTHVLAQHSQRAFRSLREAGARVSLDILADGVHSIGQDMINVGTTRVMQTVFRERKRIRVDQFQVALVVSMDSEPAPAAPRPALRH